MMKIVANHVHVIPDEYGKKHQTFGTISDLLEDMEKYQLDTAIIYPPIPPLRSGLLDYFTGGDQNRWCGEVTKSNSDKLVFWATVDLTKRDHASQLERAYSFGAKGVKLHPTSQAFRPNDKKMYSLYSKAVELGLPILFHTGYHRPHPEYSMPMLLDAVAEEFPDLVIILEHLGFPFYNSGLSVVAHRENVYGGITQILRVDGRYPVVVRVEDGVAFSYVTDRKPYSRFPTQSLCLRPSVFTDHAKYIGGHKFIWGVDWPYNRRPDITIDIVRSLPIDEQDKRGILGENILKVIGSSS